MRDLGDQGLSRNFAGSLLVAHPNMMDPNFRRTVLFVSEHQPDEGALGVIINRPLDRRVAELVSDTPPAGFAEMNIEPEGAFWHRTLGEFLLPYEVMRTDPHPRAALLSFLQSSYACAAELGGWDRGELERPAIATPPPAGRDVQPAG